VAYARQQGRPTICKCSSTQWLLQLRPLTVQVFDHRLVLIRAHGRDRRGECMGFRVMRGREQEHSWAIRMLEAAKPHVLAFARKGGYREAIAERAAERRHIRFDAIELLRPGHVPSEAGDHLIENDQSALFPAQPLDFMQESVCRILVAGGLEDQGPVRPDAGRTGPLTLAISLYRKGTLKFRTACGWPGEIGAAAEGRLHRAEHGWIGMPQAYGTIAHAEFDVFVSIDLPDMAPQTTLDEAWRKNGYRSSPFA